MSDEKQNGLVNVAKCLFECLDVICWVLILTISVRHLINPRWLEKLWLTDRLTD
jgi:hypothetical protein